LNETRFYRQLPGEVHLYIAYLSAEWYSLSSSFFPFNSEQKLPRGRTDHVSKSYDHVVVNFDLRR